MKKLSVLYINKKQYEQFDPIKFTKQKEIAYCVITQFKMKERNSIIQEKKGT